MKKEEIKKWLLENVDWLQEDTKLEMEDVERLSYELEQLGIFDIVLSFVGNNSSDYWVQAEYWSNKIGKTIILDCDVYATTIDEFLSKLESLEQEKNELESKLTTIK